MKFKKIISAAVGAVMLCASLPIGTMVNLTDNVLKANAVDEPYSESEYPSESYYYGSEDTSEEASWVEDTSEAPQESAVTWARTTTTTANIKYEVSSPKQDDLSIYFFSVEKSFDKLTYNLSFTGGTPKNVTYRYNDRDIAGPCDVFVKGTHMYELTVLADGVIAGTVTVYIGVKGDANLDDEVNSKDAVAVLDTYAYALLDMNKSLQIEASLENLANYLADIDNESLNYSYLDSRDAMYILQFYAMDIAEQNPLWSNICKDLADRTYSLDSSDFQINYGDEAANTVITVGSVSVKPGTKTVSVPVTISGNVGFACFGFVFRYDKKINFKNCKEGLVYIPGIANTDSFLATTSAKSKDVKDNGALFTLEFEIPADAKDGDEFKIEPSLGEFLESGGRDVAVKLVTGSIKIEDKFDKINLEVGKKVIINNNQDNVTYTTSDSNVAVVSKSGEITAIKEGTAIITVINSDGETQQITVKVGNINNIQATTIGSYKTATKKGVSSSTTITTTTVTTDSKEVKLGDINNDGKIDSKDAVLVLKSYAESLVNNNATVDLSGDVNGDKKVDAKDAVIILKYYAATLTGFKGNISEFK